MSEFKRYQNTQVVEARPVTENDLLLYAAGDSIPASFQFNASGTPRMGDMMARNPDNPRLKWVVPKEDFEKNYKPVEDSATKSISTKIHYHAGRPTDPRTFCELDRVAIFRDTNIITALYLFEQQCLEIWPPDTQIVIDNIKLEIKIK